MFGNRPGLCGMFQRPLPPLLHASPRREADSIYNKDRCTFKTHNEVETMTPRIFCIGLNYARHIKELDNAVPTEPVVFMKPASCLVAPGKPIHFPGHGRELHHEVELVVEIGRPGKDIAVEDAGSYIRSFTLGLDLTLRDVQRRLRESALPWEASKAFEQSSPVGHPQPFDGSVDLADITLRCTVNGEIRQEGSTGDMIFSAKALVAALSRIWHLQPGDLIYTGTPDGVGPLSVGDRVVIESESVGRFSWDIVA